ncbi:MAG: ABC transporter permease subunit [Pauljensenia sp.]
MASPGTSPSTTTSPTHRTTSHARDVGGRGFFLKLVLVMLVDALGVYGILTAWSARSWAVVTVLVLLLVAVNVVYFSPRMLPAKYLLPGLVFVLVYQVFVMGYTGYVSLTNYGQGHNSTQEDAISAILQKHEKRVEGAPTVAVAVIDDGGTLGLAVLDPDTDTVSVGTPDQPLEPVEGAEVGSMGITAVPGHDVLTFAQLSQRQQEVAGLAVPVSEDPSDGHYVTTDGSKGYLARSTFTYDAATDSITDSETGITYTATDAGAFVAPDGTELTPGWRVFVGLENFTDMVVSRDLGGPFLRALVWSFVFAGGSVLTTFVLGLFLALVFSDTRVRGRRIYQSLLILPYAFPAFLATLVWKGMLNERFGFVNQVLLGGAEIPWLTDGMLAKVAILGVNLWLGFPYMFLVCMGTLQSLPSDVLEAAKIDGAGALRTVWSVKLPLVLQATVPLLIASFAFNFNNFSLIYMLTGGGPNYPGLSVPVGETDILISMVYKIAFDRGGQDYGLASAMSIVIFIVVGLIAWAGFRRTRALEDL